jgi:dTMP kinase
VSLFITFEGIEGSGKSSHARTLAAALRARGHQVTETREPGGTPAGAAISADRTQHVTDVVRPALARGEIVVCDRFSDSTIAYQGYGRGLDVGVVQALDARARDGLAPALTFVLDCPAVVGLARARARAGLDDRFERESLAFHERVRMGFGSLAAEAPERIVVVDSTADAASVEARVAAATLGRLERAA